MTKKVMFRNKEERDLKKQMKSEKKPSKFNRKGVFTLVALALVTFIFWSTEGLFATVIAPFDYYFTIMLRYAIACFQEDLISYGILCLLLQIGAWLIFAFIVKVSIFNFLFPKIRIVDSLKNTITYARKIKMIEGDDPHFMYMRIKFKFFPVLRWHTFKVPKPEEIRVGIPLLTRRTIKLENGISGIEWRRMPSTLDIITQDINLDWNDKEEVYQLSNINIDRTADPADSYRAKTADVIKRLSQNVNESVRGDAGLLKDQYQTGIPITTDMMPDKQKETIALESVEVRPRKVKKDLRHILEVTEEDVETEDIEKLHKQIDELGLHD